MPHPGFLDLFAQTRLVTKSIEALSNDSVPFLTTGLRTYEKVLYAATLFQRTNKHVLMVYSCPEEAIVARRQLVDLIGDEKVIYFPPREVMPFENKDNREALWMRIACLNRLAGPGDPCVTVTTATSLMRKLLPEKGFIEGRMTLKKGDRVLPHEIVRLLVNGGYEKTFTVNSRGQVALRGGILDVFPPVAREPFRIEFFDDEVDTIRLFDPETQSSFMSVKEAPISVAEDCDCSRGVLLTDYLPTSCICIVDDYDKCLESIDEFQKIGLDIAGARLDAGTMQKEEAGIYFPAFHVASFLSSSNIFMSLVPKNMKNLSFKRLVESDTHIQPGFHGKWDDLLFTIKSLVSSNKRVVLMAGSQDRLELLERWVRKQELPMIVRHSVEEEPSSGVVVLALGSGENGFSCETIRLVLFTEAELYGKPKVRQIRRKKVKIPLDWRQLSAGDYVVHIHHGVGRFMGIKTMTVNGVTRDYLHIAYAGTDALYVPTDQVGLVEKYVGPDSKAPTLQRLGTADWSRVKSKVKASVEDMAKKLIMLEAKRKAKTGHAFPADTLWQKEFEEAFEYEDTEDQIVATQEIKRDMEKSVPMDRLLCGDVGYGKTEVAMRAAFKAVMDSKQVGVLVPTTILAEQHYATFSRRFSDYPVTVSVLSRFRSVSEQKAIVSRVNSGAIDIVIGTHRLLSKDVKFKKLGLLIVDEEQKFGVAQKERIKELSAYCDVLTLTATPIPRTLNMALSGLRDISVIEIPPQGRFPVETYVLPYNPSLVSQAIRREMRRGGQVFYVSNRVRSIGHVYQKVKSLVPEARIAVGHGRMKEQELSSTMQDFLLGRYDVLVATTIVESGLDLPNVNTLIVEDADKLGLAQLYQLKGRVGRSNKVAYAYFTYKPGRHLTFEAEERLNALRDFADMGSGFKLAMRDMEIRGAGNLLGQEQHGFMSLVGYDFYIRLLEQAIKSLQGIPEEKEKRISTVIDIPCDAYLPESYIPDAKERFMFYKEIAGAEDTGMLQEIRGNLRDRYGNFLDVVDNLLGIALMKLICGQLGITHVSLYREGILMPKNSLTFRIGLPKLFPAGRLQAAAKELNIEIKLNARINVFFVTLPNVSPAQVLKKSLSLVKHLLHGE